MMMTLGYFVFSRTTAPYQKTEQSMVWRHPTNARVNARPSSQFVGVGDETFHLSGVLMPEVTGGDSSLEQLITMADQGAPYPLIDGSGKVYGHYVIERISRSRSEFFQDGSARKIEFSVELKRVDDTDLPELLRLNSTAKLLGSLRNL
ncbi:phage tail protein [Shewanella sp.]|uniref:phage tail protein n=1 Tax=Shewanella sp. TaxID=50422 RepID=UPI003A976271